MNHFRYIDTIRKPDDSLRDWKEHDILTNYENNETTFSNYTNFTEKKI